LRWSAFIYNKVNATAVGVGDRDGTERVLAVVPPKNKRDRGRDGRWCINLIGGNNARNRQCWIILRRRSDPAIRNEILQADHVRRSEPRYHRSNPTPIVWR